MLVYLTFMWPCLVFGIVRSECTPEKTCDGKVIECIKKENGGSYPIKAWTGLEILWNKNYSIVWYSKPHVKGFDCITTVFQLSGAKDTYTNQCKKVEEVDFQTKLGLINKEFTISDYKGINMKAYAIYFKKGVLALYVCSPYGIQSPHVTVYCPTAKLADPAVQAAVEEAKTILSKCNINDGVATCQNQCQMAVSRRNPLPLPPVQYEERLWRPLEWQGCLPGWQNTVCTHCRLNMNHTLASVRWNHRLRGPLCPRHSLDLGLSAVYTHGPEDFPDKSDVVRQPETVGLPTWRLLRNKRHDPTQVPYNISMLGMGPATTSLLDLSSTRQVDAPVQSLGSGEYPRCVDPTHPLRFGGLLEKRSPSCVKLGISSHHSPQSNHGYSRNSYGAFYTS